MLGNRWASGFKGLAGRTAAISALLLLAVVLFYVGPAQLTDTDTVTGSSWDTQAGRPLATEAARPTTGLAAATAALVLPTVPASEGRSMGVLHGLIEAHVTSSPGQQQEANYLDVVGAIVKRAPANVLVFGLGRDTPLYYHVRACT